MISAAESVPRNASLSSALATIFRGKLCDVVLRNRGFAAAGRVANQERQRIERSEVIQSGRVSAASQVGGEKQTKQVSETAKRAAMRPEGGYVALNLTREGSRHMLFAQR
jgi:hypothetical protein